MSLMKQLDEERRLRGDHRSASSRRGWRGAGPPASRRRDASGRGARDRHSERVRPEYAAAGACSACGTVNDADAAFCKRCGRRARCGGRRVTPGCIRSRDALSVTSTPALCSSSSIARRRVRALRSLRRRRRRCPTCGRCRACLCRSTTSPPGTVTFASSAARWPTSCPGQDVELRSAGVVAHRQDQRRGPRGVHRSRAGHARQGDDGRRWRAARVAGVRCAGNRRRRVDARSPPPRRGSAASRRHPQSAGPESAARVRARSCLGDQTRFVFEMGDEALTGFYILQIVNAPRTPVQPTEVVHARAAGGRAGCVDDAGLVAAGDASRAPRWSSPVRSRPVRPRRRWPSRCRTRRASSLSRSGCRSRSRR